MGIVTAESGAMGIAIRATLQQIWNGEAGAWEDWSQYEMTADGTVWVVGKGGNPRDKAIESLCKSAGWDGNLEHVTNGSWQPTPCQFVVNEDSYRDQVRYKISFVNDFDQTPGGVGNVTAEKAKELQAKFGAQFRALAGNAVRNAAKPVGKPATPKPTKTTKSPLKNARPVDVPGSGTDVNAALQETASGQDDVPF
jgi:hypothetical protein